jgi:hypothetical protein
MGFLDEAVYFAGKPEGWERGEVLSMSKVQRTPFFDILFTWSLARTHTKAYKGHISGVPMDPQNCSFLAPI